MLDFSENDQAEIGMLAIAPEYQGCGIGPLFANYVEQEAFKKVSSLILRIIPLSQEKLIQCYEKAGYRMLKETIPFPEPNKALHIREEYRDGILFASHAER